jgi:hypothetical protein
MSSIRLGQIMCQAAILSFAVMVPASALDYEAKPIKWCIEAPFRTVGALSGGAVCGLTSGPIDDGFHTGAKATKRLAGTFGDEKGNMEILAAAPIMGPSTAALGGVHGAVRGFYHGMKLGWEKPFSRWSYITEEEK